MASRMDKWGWKLPYAGYFGGVGSMPAAQFEQVNESLTIKAHISFWFKVNGFSNMFWGWGCEDDDMQSRLRSKKSYLSIKI